jgi:hypothetical protein
MEAVVNIRPNPDNPRTITTEAFNQLKAKIQRNPDGLTANKIVHKDGIIIAGNQRWRAINDLKLELQDDWFKDVSGWTDEQVREYLVTSNISDGVWDWDILSSTYDHLELEAWGLEIPNWDDKEDKDPTEKDSDDTRSTHVCPSCGVEFDD